MLSGVQYPFPKNLSLNFNQLPICLFLSHPKIPSCPKARKTERKSLRGTRAASSDRHGAGPFPSCGWQGHLVCSVFPDTDLSRCSPPLRNCLFIHLSSTQFWCSTLPPIRCYRGTCIPTLNAVGMSEGPHSQTASFSPANGLSWPAAPGFATAFLFPSPITFLSCLLAQWPSHPGRLLSHAGCGFPPWVCRGSFQLKHIPFGMQRNSRSGSSAATPVLPELFDHHTNVARITLCRSRWSIFPITLNPLMSKSPLVCLWSFREVKWMA